MDPTPDIEIEIFRAGTHTAMSGDALTFSVADIKAIAAAYDPARHEAPVVLGHPATDDPAYGWVKALRATDDGRLLARLGDLDPAFAEAVRARRYAKVSAAFWQADAGGNPTPGRYALRHLGFLGATPPAVKGLKAPVFAGDGSGVVELCFFATPSPDPGETMSDKTPVPAPDTARVQEQEAALAKREADLKVKEQELAARDAAFAESERKARRASDEAVLEKLIGEGRVLPGEKVPLAAVLAFMDGTPAGGTVEFADPTGATIKQAPGAVLLKLLSGLPVRVDYTECSAPEAPGSGTAAFAAPSGFSVDPERGALHAKAMAYQRAHPNTDYRTAVAAVGGK